MIGFYEGEGGDFKGNCGLMCIVCVSYRQCVDRPNPFSSVVLAGLEVLRDSENVLALMKIGRGG